MRGYKALGRLLTVNSVFEDGEAVMFLGLEASNVRWSFASTFQGCHTALLLLDPGPNSRSEAITCPLKIILINFLKATHSVH